MKDVKERFMYILGAFVVGMASTVVILTMILPIPEKSHDIVIFAIGQLMGMALAVVGYFYGSSKSSADKNDTIAATADKLAVAKVDTDAKLAEAVAEKKGGIMIPSLEVLGVKPDLNAKYYDSILTAINYYEINTPLRLSHFFAQVLHESGMLKYSEELASGKAYEGRQDLGNIQAGDGEKFKGRGFIQLTGRKVYITYGAFINEDFIANPELVATPKFAADSAGWFWTKFKKDIAGHNLNEMADDNLFLRITYFVNGGFNGVQDRLRLLDRAYKVFGVTDAKIKIESILGAILLNVASDDKSAMEKSLFKHFPTEASVEECRKGLDT